MVKYLDEPLGQQMAFPSISPLGLNIIKIVT